MAHLVSSTLIWAQSVFNVKGKVSVLQVVQWKWKRKQIKWNQIKPTPTQNKMPWYDRILAYCCWLLWFEISLHEWQTCSLYLWHWSFKFIFIEAFHMHACIHTNQSVLSCMFTGIIIILPDKLSFLKFSKNLLHWKFNEIKNRDWKDEFGFDTAR